MIAVQTEKNNSPQNNGFTYSEVTHCATTFTKLNGCSSNYHNSIDIFITYNGSVWGAGSEICHTYYFPMQFRKVSVNEDGTLNVSVDAGILASYFANGLKSAIEHLQDGDRNTATRIN